MRESLRLALGVSLTIFGLAAPGLFAESNRPSGAERWQAISNGAYAYNLYCANCHGPSGRGNGLTAARLRTPVPDLTRISERRGRYDRTFIVEHILATNTWERGPMPAWGAVLRSHNGRSDAYTLLTAHNLMRHVASLQDVRATR
jgi:mono/diheme cytochrome c family protein